MFGHLGIVASIVVVSASFARIVAAAATDAGFAPELRLLCAGLAVYVLIGAAIAGRVRRRPLVLVPGAAALPVLALAAPHLDAPVALLAALATITATAAAYAIPRAAA
jgi:low temperature requirement protein LtrA